MAEQIANVTCDDCEDTVDQCCAETAPVPGPKGDAGSDGADGADGSNAYTTTTAAFVQPAVNNTVTVDVADGNWAAIGQIVFVVGAGYYEVAASGATTLTLENLGYDANVAPATVIGQGAKVSPAGEKGDSSAVSPTFDDLAPVATNGGIIVHNGTTYIALAAGANDHMVPRINTALAHRLVWERINFTTWNLAGTLAVGYGGTGATTAAGARTNLAAAKNGINSDITQLQSLSSLQVDATDGTPVVGIYYATANLNFGVIASTAYEDLTITVTGALTGDSVALALPAAPEAGIIFMAFVSAADTVTVRATNITGAPINPAAADYAVTVIQH